VTPSTTSSPSPRTPPTAGHAALRSPGPPGRCRWKDRHLQRLPRLHRRPARLSAEVHPARSPRPA
jgi:hypothetical protein